MNRKTVVIFVLAVVIFLVIQVAEAKKKDSDESEEKSSKKKKKEESEEGEADESSNENEKKAKGFFKEIKTCQGNEWEQPKGITKAFKKCEEKRKKEDEEKKKDAKKGKICEAACLWKENDLFTGEPGKYKVDQDAVDEFVDEMLPAGPLKAGRPALKKEWKACKKEIDATDDDDAKCSRYKDYFNCIKFAFKKHCDGMEGGGMFNFPGGMPMPGHPRPGGLLGGLLG